MNEKRLDRLFKILAAIQCGKNCTIEELVELTQSSRRTFFVTLTGLGSSNPNCCVRGCAHGLKK